MKQHIQKYLNQPEELERLYRKQPYEFQQAFEKLYPEIQSMEIAQFWNQRLAYENHRPAISWGKKGEWLLITGLALLAGLVAKLPEYMSWDEEIYYQKHIGFIVFPFMCFYLLWRQKAPIQQYLWIGAVMLCSALYINLFPFKADAQTFELTQIHLPLLLWGLTGWAFVGNYAHNLKGRLAYLRFNGELAVITAVILISGMILTGISVGLFSIIDVHVEDLYFRYIVVWGLSAAPLVATYIIHANPGLVQKVSPLIARIFSPLVLITLVCYLIAVGVTGQSPYQDRDFLLLFNMLLIGVMAIVVFAIAATSQGKKFRWNEWIIWSLTLVTLIINAIALSAIVFRLSSWGITPNRLAVLGGNLMIFANLITIFLDLTRVIRQEASISSVEKSVATFLPYHLAWTVVVSFIFPIFFNFYNF